MIKNLWGKIKIYCDLHETPVIMNPELSHGLIYYVCDEGLLENKKENTPLCKTRLSIKDFDKMIDHISKTLYDAQMNNEVANLKNTKFVINRVHYRVFDHTDDEIKIAVTNKQPPK